MIRFIFVLLFFSLSFSSSYAARIIYSAQDRLVLRSDYDTDNFSSFAFPKLKAIIQSCNGMWRDWTEQDRKGRDCEPKTGPKLYWVKDLSSSCESIYAYDDFGGVSITDQSTCGYSELFLGLTNGCLIQANSPIEIKPTYHIMFRQKDASIFGDLLVSLGASITDSDKFRFIELKEYGSCQISSALEVETLSCTAIFR